MAAGLDLNPCVNDSVGGGKLCGLLKNSCGKACENAPHVVPAQQSFVLNLPNSSEWIWGGDIWGSASKADGLKSHDIQTWLPFKFDAKGMPLPLENLPSWDLKMKSDDSSGTRLTKTRDSRRS